jgi:cation transport ATPase
MGAMGMEPAIAAADIVLMSNELQNIVFIHSLAKKVMRLIKQNIFLGFGLIHILGITLALMALITPIEAALFHAVSDLLILLNSARLIRFAIK